jgi:hypothetical protein
VTGKRFINCKFRAKFADPVSWRDDNGEKHESPSPNTLWDTDLLYQQFVKEEVSLKLKQKGTFLPSHFANWLGGKGTYNWYFMIYRKSFENRPAARPTGEGDRPARLEFLTIDEDEE